GCTCAGVEPEDGTGRLISVEPFHRGLGGETEFGDFQRRAASRHAGGGYPAADRSLFCSHGAPAAADSIYLAGVFRQNAGGAGTARAFAGGVSGGDADGVGASSRGSLANLRSAVSG